MNAVLAFYNSSIGKKVVVAVTGFVLFLFVIGHMVGNWKAFAGYDPTTGLHKLDMYAEFLREVGHQLVGHGTALWGARIGLLICLVLHLVTVFQLRARNKAARQVGYAQQESVVSSIGAKTMWFTGPVLLAYIIYHILHMTLGTVHFSGFKEGAVYANVYGAFRNWYVTGFYIIGMAALAVHLFHGIWSMFQTLGLDNPDRNEMLRVAAKVLAVVIFLGFVAVPLGVFLGLVPEPTSQVLLYDQLPTSLHA